MSGLREKFKKAAAPVVNGISGAFAAHAGCFMLPIGAAALGVSLSGAFLTGVMYLGAPLMAAGLTAAVSKRKTGRIHLKKTGRAAVFALAATVGIQAAHIAVSEHQPTQEKAEFDMKAFLDSRPMCAAPTAS